MGYYSQRKSNNGSLGLIGAIIVIAIFLFLVWILFGVMAWTYAVGNSIVPFPAWKWWVFVVFFVFLAGSSSRNRD